MINILFNSYIFIFVFLPIVLFLYFINNKYKKFNIANIILILSSLFFYAYNKPMYLIIIISSIIVNYYIGTIIFDMEYTYKPLENKLIKKILSKKFLFILGIVFNLFLLGYFKYYNFFLENINSIFNIKIRYIQASLPLGISFFTFQQISYLVDSYKSEGKKYKFLEYMLFVCFFPQLVAGPIVLPQEIIPQFEDKKNRKLNYKNISEGIYLFSIGLFKKVMIADTLSGIVNLGYSTLSTINSFEAWLVALSFTLQLYFDFSGYWDMAAGIALMFNIKLPKNFNSPYKALNIQEFWKRWHITLGRFLTQYIYIPLGGNRGSRFKTYRNLFIVFIVSGIWHGAGWNFIVWGTLYGLAIVIHRIFKDNGRKMNKILAWFLTFMFVNLAWVFFRAPNLIISVQMLQKLIFIDFTPIKNILQNGVSYISIIKNFTLLEAINNIYLSIFMFVLGTVIIFIKNSFQMKENFKASYLQLGFIVTIFIITLLNLTNISEFLYFNF